MEKQNKAFEVVVMIVVVLLFALLVYHYHQVHKNDYITVPNTSANENSADQTDGSPTCYEWGC